MRDQQKEEGSNNPKNKEEEKNIATRHPELARQEEDFLREKQQLFTNKQSVDSPKTEDGNNETGGEPMNHTDETKPASSSSPPKELQRHEEELLRQKKLLLINISSADQTPAPADNQMDDQGVEQNVNAGDEETGDALQAAVRPPQLMRSNRNDSRPASVPGAIPYAGTEASTDDTNDPSQAFSTDNDSDAQGEGGGEALVSAVVVDEEMQARAAEEKARENILQEMVQGEVVQHSIWKRPMVLVVAALLVIVIAVVLVVTLTGSDTSNSDPKEEAVAAMSDYDYLVEVLSPISGQALLLNQSSSQNMAFRWMLYQDNFSKTAASSNNNVTIQTIAKDIVIERYALGVLYYSTQGDDWLRDVSFLSNTSVCEWPRTKFNESKTHGVSCNGNQRVTDVTLSDMNLNGTIPAELGQLQFLRNLKFDDNVLHGSLPDALSELNFLTQFSAANNLITGSIPESYAGLNNLESIKVSGNAITGALPKNILKIETLKGFFASFNQINGSIPEVLPRGKLAGLWLGGNQLEKKVPDSLFRSNQLSELALFDNQLTGTLGNSIGRNWDKLWLCYLDGNDLTGSLPTELGLLKSIEFLWLSKNSFTGAIPSELGELAKFGVLTELFIGSNQLSGEVPPELGLLSSVSSISITNTSVTGDLDPIFCSNPVMPTKLSTDCGGEFPETNCSCCTSCCDDLSGECEAKVDSICQRMAQSVKDPSQPMEFVITNDDVKPLEPICECSDIVVPTSTNQTCFNGKCPVIEVTCRESANCTVCTPDGSVCGRRMNFGYTWDDNGSWTHQKMGFQYTKGRDDILFLDFDVSSGNPPYGFKIYLNGELCNELNSYATCVDGHAAFEVDCSNVQEGAIYSQCDGLVDNAGPLEYFTPTMYGVASSCDTSS